VSEETISILEKKPKNLNFWVFLVFFKLKRNLKSGFDSPQPWLTVTHQQLWTKDNAAAASYRLLTMTVKSTLSS